MTDSAPTPSVYLGKIQYSATQEEVENALTEAGFGDFTKVDLKPNRERPGDNRGFAFVHFNTWDDVQRLLDASANAPSTGFSLLVRGLNMEARPPREQQQRQQTDGGSFGGSFGGGRRQYSQPQNEASNKLYVGGLPSVQDDAQNDAEIRQLFQGFNVVEVQSRKAPREMTSADSEYRHFAFVVLESVDEANRAIVQLDRQTYDAEGHSLRVNFPRGNNNFNNFDRNNANSFDRNNAIDVGGKPGYRQNRGRGNYQYGGTGGRQGIDTESRPAGPPRALDGATWRRGT